MINALIFICALPFSVWLLANICCVFDEPKRAPAALRLVASLCVLVGFLLLTSATFWQPIIWALALVVVAHLLSYYVLFRPSLGAAIYRQQPPTTPLLVDEEPEGHPYQ
ncbi:MAG: hypothetical protein NXH95_13920 [Pseudomonadaceae bacterium]|nr:hypothetical protein [Pseudomonadaceae bacterium]